MGKEPSTCFDTASSENFRRSSIGTVSALPDREVDEVWFFLHFDVFSRQTRLLDVLAILANEHAGGCQSNNGVFHMRKQAQSCLISEGASTLVSLYNEWHSAHHRCQIAFHTVSTPAEKSIISIQSRKQSAAPVAAPPCR